MKSTAGVAEIAKAVQSGEATAHSAVVAALGRIEANNARLGAFTAVLRDRAMARAESVDAMVRDGKKLPLAGVPFAVKNLYDLADLPTRAGAKLRANAPTARADAALVARLEAAGAVCLGALNMDEFAYGFTGENAHDGPAHNPHDLGHMTGGSSSGAAAAVAGGLVPVALGSDTNGSIRVPASLCGLFGLKPTFGRLSRRGMYPFVASLDHPGALARSVEDLALAYDALQGFDDSDPAMVKRPSEPISGRLERGSAGLRIAVADGYFAGDAEPRAVVEHVAAALRLTAHVSVPDVQAARSAAFLITMVEGAGLHLDRLRDRPQDFDPEVRDRLLAGALLPAAWVERAQRFRRIFRDAVLALLNDLDAIVTPATPMRAPKLGQKTALLGGVEQPIRPNLGIFTQPFSFIGLPAVTVPVWLDGHRLPLGVQVVTAPWREDIALRVARQLEKTGTARAPVAKGFADE